MDLSKLVSYEVTAASHEVIEDGAVTNVLLEVSVTHADDLENPFTWNQYLNERTAQWNESPKARKAVIFDNVLFAFEQLSKTLDERAAKSIQHVTVASPKLIEDMQAATLDDLTTHVETQQAEIVSLTTQIKAGKAAESKLAKINKNLFEGVTNEKTVETRGTTKIDGGGSAKASKL